MFFQTMAFHENVGLRLFEYVQPDKASRKRVLSDRTNCGEAQCGEMHCSAGVSVMFPFPPYDAQTSLSDTIISALANRKHALLESPTGSGKSLALLCSCLAWQQQQQRQEHCGNTSAFPVSTIACSSISAATRKGELLKMDRNDHADESVHLDDIPLRQKVKTECCESDSNSDHFLDFVRCYKRRRETKKIQRNSKRSAVAGIRPTSTKSEIRSANLSNKGCQVESIPQKPTTAAAATACSKIFYVTRTHGQIQQLIGELEKTCYRPQMNILASRHRYCINNKVKNVENAGNNLGEMCDKTAMVFGECAPLQRTHLLVDQMVRRRAPWDIEDLVMDGRGLDACPYYAARDMVSTADLVFCTYPYVLDPIIRHETKIEGDLNDAVIIIDEAHNVDEVCRAATSFEIDLLLLQKVIAEDITPFTSFHTGPARPSISYPTIYSTDRTTIGETTAIFDFVHSLFADIQSIVTSDVTMILQQRLRSSALRSDRPEFHPCFHSMVSWEAQFHWLDQNKKDLLKASHRLFFGMGVTFNPYEISVRGIAAVKQLLQCIRFATEDPDAYTAVVQVPIGYEQCDRSHGGSRTSNNSNSAKKSNTDGGSPIFQLRCSSAALGFHHLCRSVQSVLLVSGTLSPFRLYTNEFKLERPLAVSASSVANLSHQVHLVALSQSPSGVPMRGTYALSRLESYQDAIGESIWHLAQDIPAGLLCFFPSYSLMKSAMGRWTQTGLFAAIHERVKRVFVEPTDTKQFNQLIGEYRKASTQGANDACTGAVMFAVCRGKLSEGIDFIDDMARGVVVVGVPFASLYEPTVQLKRQYNDSQARRMESQQENNCCNGDEWYLMDALRAVSQAIGRCLRHRNDFGCIVLLDERYNSNLATAVNPPPIQPTAANLDCVEGSGNKTRQCSSPSGLLHAPIVLDDDSPDSRTKFGGEDEASDVEVELWRPPPPPPPPSPPPPSSAKMEAISSNTSTVQPGSSELRTDHQPAAAAVGFDELLPKWLRSHIRHQLRYDDAVSGNIEAFFRSNGLSSPSGSSTRPCFPSLRVNRQPSDSGCQHIDDCGDPRHSNRNEAVHKPSPSFSALFQSIGSK